jgi:hypothetical protein
MATIRPEVTSRRTRRTASLKKPKTKEKEEVELEEADPADPPQTMSVPEAGWRYFKIGKNASYAAAERGDIPVIKVGKLLRVPIRAMERLLDEVGRRVPAE